MFQKKFLWDRNKWRSAKILDFDHRRTILKVQNVQLPTSPPEGKPQSCQHSPSPISEQTIVPKPHVEPTNQMQKTEFRNVHISVGMMEAFLQVARANTAREIETCAILAGPVPSA